MAKNEFTVRRVAFGNFTFPANTSTNTASTLSATLGVYIPKGALITNIRLFPADAQTNIANMANGTINFLVGGQVIGTDDRKMSEALVAGTLATMAVSSGAGAYVSAGGLLVANFASTDANRTGISLDADVYVEYLYAGERDLV